MPEQGTEVPTLIVGLVYRRDMAASVAVVWRVGLRAVSTSGAIGTSGIALFYRLVALAALDV